MPRKPQKPLFVKDVDRMRGRLNISAENRVRVILQAGDRKLGVLLECFCCEELLESAQNWWVCPVCGDQTTEEEAQNLLRACCEGLKVVLGESDGDVGTTDKDEGKADESPAETDEGPRSGRWVDRIRWLMGS